MKITAFIFFVFTISTSAAQFVEECINESYIEHFEQLFPESKEARYAADKNVVLRGDLKSSTINMPIKAYILRTSAGTGGLALCDLREALDTVNVQYQGAMYNFYICDLEYIDSDTYYNIGSFTEGDNLYLSNNDPGAINMYFVNNAAGYCGWANFPSSSYRYVMMQNGCTMNTSTFAHELGHYFGLYHTHQGGNELVNGSNCTTAGDLLCDTPADPTLSGLVTSFCQYVGSGTDANGDLYVPDPLNMMSYSVKECRDFFSSDQVARMDFYYVNYRQAQFNCSGSVNLCCTSGDSDGDGVCDDVDQCPGQNDNIIGTTCEDGDVCTTGETYDGSCNCTGGTFQDSDGDGVCDANDICPGYDDNIDSDDDGIPDGCDIDCEDQSGPFPGSPLTHSGTGSSSTTKVFASESQLISFNITNIGQKTNGNPNNRYIDVVDVTYVDNNGSTVNYGSFSGSNVSSVAVSITGIAQSITVALSDGYDGNTSQTISVNIGTVDYCAEPCADGDGDGVCDVDDVCPGFDDNVDSDGDGIPDGCDDCNNQYDSFSMDPLSHSGTGSTTSSVSLANSEDIEFTISGIGSKTNGNPNNRYIDIVNITYQDGGGATFNLGPYSGQNVSSVDISIPGAVVLIDVSLSDGYDGNANNISVNLSNVSSCNVPAVDEDKETAQESPIVGLIPNDIMIYPNPVYENLRISTSVDISSATIFNVTGQNVGHETNWEGKIHSLNVSSFEVGLYYIVFETAQGRLVKKFVKQ